MGLEISKTGMLGLPTWEPKEGVYLIEYFGKRPGDFARRVAPDLYPQGLSREAILSLIESDIDSADVTLVSAYVQIQLWDSWYTLYRYFRGTGLEEVDYES